MSHKYILFDLDGTLTDPKEGITKSVAYSLKKMRNIEVDVEELTKFIGPPLMDSYSEYYGFTEEESRKAIEYYREYFKDKGIYENIIYDGIKELLEKLKNKGKVLVVATSKPTVFAEVIIRHFDLEGYFTFIVGSNLDGSRTRKSEVIEAALKKLGINDLADVVMIGDRKHDIMGAKEVNVDSIGVVYGYGSFDELKKAGADHVVNSVNELSMLFEG